MNSFIRNIGKIVLAGMVLERREMRVISESIYSGLGICVTNYATAATQLATVHFEIYAPLMVGQHRVFLSAVIGIDVLIVSSF